MKPMIDRTDQFTFALRMLLCGFCFWIASALWPEAMTEAAYGPLAYDIDAETWAMGFMSAAGLVLYGVHINGRKPLYSPIMRIAGHGMLMCMFAFLAVSALMATEGSVVAIFGAIYFVPECAGFVRSNIRDLAARYGTR